ncbi:uncharacterized protein EV422DRAFT_121252 [Fimicolochytrium jonesii]|uniref:uncharacterized protein n=1 Tax=Fimicolochytrium jonesii TaxID=1396493 RepID=UPI0022FDFE76|nr:uncharacterized protein EV422DRAFT_121252 [Fimicolochytrium jonesii]KAI8819202.1 hypothetical protein EV422DRAFT_121252 [Fimicolochytrium jonesii]
MAFAVPNRMVFLVWVGQVCAVVMLVITSYLMAQVMTAPLERIARAADEIRHERATIAQIPVIKGHDEVARLSTSLNALVASLLEKEAKLEDANNELLDKIELVQNAEANLRANEEKFRQLTDTTDEAFFIYETTELTSIINRKPMTSRTGSLSQVHARSGLLKSPTRSPSKGSLHRLEVSRVAKRPSPAKAPAEPHPEIVYPEHLIYASAAFPELFGISFEELEQDPLCWLERVLPEDRAGTGVLFADRRKHPLDISFRIAAAERFPNPKPRHIALHTLPVIPMDGTHQVRRVVGVFRDITKQREAEMESSHKSAWVRQVGHEIRNPLSATFTMINLLLETSLDAEQADLLQTIKMSNDTLLSLINSILDLAKLEAGEMTLESIPLSLAAQVEDVLELMAPQAHKKGLRIGGYVDADVDAWVKGDPLRIRQALINLCTNSLKFTKTGSVFIRVERATRRTRSVSGLSRGSDNRKVSRREGSLLRRRSHDSTQDSIAGSLNAEVGSDPPGQRMFLRFSVSDTGIGISPENQKQLWEPFKQATASTSRQYGGTGLGLSIVKELVTMMDGEAGVSSEPGKGSTFYFSACLTSLSHEDLAHIPDTEDKSTVSIAGKRVLILSEWTRMRELCRSMVMSITGKSVEAETLAEATSMLAQATNRGAKIDALITDFNLFESVEVRDFINRASVQCRVAIIAPREQRDALKGVLVPGRVIAITDPVRVSVARRQFGELICGYAQEAGAYTLARKPAVAAAPDTPLLDEDGNPISLMLVDDNSINLKAVSKLLSKITQKLPVTASDGQQCLDILTRMKEAGEPLPVLIFMDVCMPVMDGLTATRNILQTYSDDERPAIVTMTANALHQDYLECMAAGADGYLLKPASKDVLRKTIETWWRVVRDKRLGLGLGFRRGSVPSLHLEELQV